MIKRVNYSNGQQRWIPLVMSFVAIATALVPMIAGLLRISNATAAASQAYSWKNVVTGGGGGFVADIIFNQKQKDLIYARTDIGGAYRWNPSTSTWTPLLDWVSPDQSNMTGVESLATDPANPNRLYIATGTYTNSFTSMNGVILRSTNQGQTFQQTMMPFKMGGNMPGRGMSERLAIDPNDDAILYFGARSGNGLWKSTNYGVTWSKVSNFPDTGPFVEKAGDAYQGDPLGIPWVTFDPSTGTPGNPTKTIYAGVGDNRSGVSNIYRSIDGGVTWAPISGEPTCSVSGTKVTCTGGATWDTGSDASNGYLPHQGKIDANGTLYVTYSDWDGPYNGSHGDVWKFTPKTSTWTKISPVPGSDSAKNFFGYGGLGVDMLHPGTLVVAAVNMWFPDGMLFRSTDGGTTWKPIWEWANYPNRTLHYTMDTSNAPWLNFGNTKPVAPSPAVKLGWMMEGLNIDPFNSDRMFYGTGATIYGTTNLTAWDTGGQVAIKSMAMGIEEEAVIDLISPPANAHLYSIVGDVGGWRHDDLTKSPAAMYSIPYAGTYAAIDYAELKPNFLVRVGYGNPNANPPVTSSAFSNDGGLSWSAGKKDIPGLSTSGGTAAAAADASRVLWAPKSAPISYSTDNGNTWIASSNIPQNAVVASDRVNPKKFYGYGQGKFWRSTDGGATFTSTSTSGLPQINGSVVIKAMPGHEGDIWIAGGASGIWHSTDSGTTFIKLSNVTGADSIGFGMAAPGQNYMALYAIALIDGIHGIFRSDDQGKTWIRINDDQHQYGSTCCITGDPRLYGRVYFGTNGLGIIYGDISQQGSTQPSLGTQSRPASRSTATVRVS
jgi:xyloglucan-specific exo-beta-1,4-glucanase